MREIYKDIIQKRRDEGREAIGQDMICNLMNCSYKDGGAVPDHEIAHMMITLLMAGQNTSSSASTWIVLHLAPRQDVTEELYQGQLRVLAGVTESEERILVPLQYADLEKLLLLQNVVKETLRVRSSIHFVMRKATRPMSIPGIDYIIPIGRILLASALATARSEEHFTSTHGWDPYRWDASKLDDDFNVDANVPAAEFEKERSAWKQNRNRNQPG